MRTVVKYLLGTFYRPLLSKYLSSVRTYSYRGIRLIIPPEVFHPGFFFSTKLLLQYISGQVLEKRSFLELGAGNGLISVYAAKRGALVTATDINPVAVEYLDTNKNINHCKMQIIHSDLFEHIPPQSFDYIAINPPYYKQAPKKPIDHAWFCGENGEYFDRLFRGLGSYIHDNSQVLMILSDGCDLDMIRELAAAHGWSMQIKLTRKKIIEDLFIFSIIPGGTEFEPIGYRV